MSMASSVSFPSLHSVNSQNLGLSSGQLALIPSRGSNAWRLACRSPPGPFLRLPPRPARPPRRTRMHLAPSTSATSLSKPSKNFRTASWVLRRLSLSSHGERMT